MPLISRKSSDLEKTLKSLQVEAENEGPEGIQEVLTKSQFGRGVASF